MRTSHELRKSLRETELHPIFYYRNNIWIQLLAEVTGQVLSPIARQLYREYK